MNVILRGRTKEIVETLVKEGYANSQSEAVRLAIVDFGQHHLSEVEMVNRKLDKLNKGIEEGRIVFKRPRGKTDKKNQGQ